MAVGGDPGAGGPGPVPPQAALQAAVALGDGQPQPPAAGRLHQQLPQLVAEDAARHQVEDHVKGVLRGAELPHGRQHQLVGHPPLEQRVVEGALEGGGAVPVVLELVEEGVGDGDGQGGEDEVEGHGQQHHRGG